MYASLPDVATRLGRTPEGAEAEQIKAWIGDVAGLIEQRIPDLHTLASEESYALRLTAIICAVVIRKIDNPQGKIQERIDDYSYGVSSEQVRSSDLTLTDAEWTRLLPGSVVSAYTVRPTYAPDRCSPW